jgi:hypothetical protein
MPHSRLSADEINRRGTELYEQQLRPYVETPENIGKIISIDVETDDYAIADDLIVAGDRVRTRHPDAQCMPSGSAMMPCSLSGAH